MKPARRCRTCGASLLLTAPARRLDCHTCSSPSFQSAKRRAARKAALDDRFMLDAITHGTAYALARREQFAKPLLVVPATADSDQRSARLAKQALAAEIAQGSARAQASTESARGVAPDLGSERLEVARLRASLGLGR